MVHLHLRSTQVTHCSGTSVTNATRDRMPKSKPRENQELNKKYKYWSWFARVLENLSWNLRRSCFLYDQGWFGSFSLKYAGGSGLGAEIRLRSARTWFLPLLHQFLTIFVKNWEKTQKCVWITEKSDAEFCQFLRWPKCSVRFSEEARRDLALEKKAKKSRLIRRNGSGKIFQRCYFSIFWLFCRNKNKKMRKKIKVRKIGPR